MPQQLAFVATDGSAKICPPERQLIRRHCMRQKNKQPHSRRSKREATRSAATYARESQIQDRKSNPRSRQIFTEDQGTSSSQCSVRNGRWQASSKYSILFSPSDWALFPFPGELDVFSQKVMHQYFIRNPIRDTLYPFKYFGIQLDFDQDLSWCFRLLSSDQLCFYAILLLTSASNDWVLRQPLSNTTRQNLRQILPILNRRLAETDAYKNDMVLYVVGILAAIAILFGDYHAAKIHATGLSKIIRLRGNSGAVDYNPAIQFSLDRLNFSSSLVTKLWTPIYDSAMWKIPVFPADTVHFYNSQSMLSIDGLVEPNLATVFHHLQYTTLLFNKHYYQKTKVNGIFIHQCLGFVHSGLIAFEGRLSKFSECLRLAMMVFLATTFRLPGLCQKTYCGDLPHKLQISYASAKASNPFLPKKIKLWITFLLLISTDKIREQHIYETCIYEAWKVTAARGLGWDETRRHLKQAMWIDSFHDDLGKGTFEVLKELRSAS